MKIFLSWSGDYSKDIALHLQKWLATFHDSLQPFCSENGIPFGADWRKQITEEMKNCELGLLIGTNSNKKAPWMMAEAGYMEGSEKCVIRLKPGGHNENDKDPFINNSFMTYSKNDFNKLLVLINKRIGEGPAGPAKTDEALEMHMDDTWPKLRGKIKSLMDKEKRHCPDRNMDQKDIDFSKDKVFYVADQDGLDKSVKAVFKPGMKVKDITVQLEKFVKSNILDNHLIEDEVDGIVQHRFMINKTRISNFISFTDGFRIAIYDRQRGPTTVKNNHRYDVYGGVHFENWSMLGKKIKNKEFADVPILSIEEITGLAFENNHSKVTEPETVVMFGYSVRVSCSDLEKILSNDPDDPNSLMHISEGRRQAFTGKANLAFDHLRSHPALREAPNPPIQHKSARRLGKLGGSEPQLKAAPRRHTVSK